MIIHAKDKDNGRSERGEPNFEKRGSLFRSVDSLAARLVSSPSIAGQLGIDFLDPSAVQAVVRNISAVRRMSSV